MDSTVMTQRSQIDSNNYPIPLAAVERWPGRSCERNSSHCRFVITARVGTVTL